MDFLDQINVEDKQSIAPPKEEKYTFSNDGNVGDLLSDMKEPLQHYDHNNDAVNILSDIEDEQEPPSSKFTEASSGFMISLIDSVQSTAFGMLSGSDDTDFGFNPENKKELTKYADLMLEGKKIMPPWAMFLVTLVFILATNTTTALSMRKENKRRLEAEDKVKELQKLIEEMEANQQREHAEGS